MKYFDKNNPQTKAYQVWWRDQDNLKPIVTATSYAEALQLAYEHIEVGLTEISNASQCPRCDNIFTNRSKCPDCRDEHLEAI